MSETGRLSEEARAFDQRVLERFNNGLIPDLDKACDVDWFYNNPWRRKQYVDFVFGDYFRFANRHIGPSRQRILEIGSGLGHMCLQLARQGHSVTGLELSSVSVEIATNYYQSLSPDDRGPGSLEYVNSDLMTWVPQQKFDVICFFLTLHHFENPFDVVSRVRQFLNENGRIIVVEPARDLFSKRNALIVYLIRQLLSWQGRWHENIELAGSIKEIDNRVEEILFEYQEAREKKESEQSPNDNSTFSESMLSALRYHFIQGELTFGNTLLPRLIGGIRGKDSKDENDLAAFLKQFDDFATSKGLIDPGVFYFFGKLKS